LKKILSIILVFILLTGMITIVNATTPNTVATTTLDRADALKEMGLFAGTNKGYELEALPTRTQAIVFLLRMLGEEKKCPKQ
jgi:hypothetical protein